MKSTQIKLAGRDVVYYEPSVPTKNTILALHGVGEKTIADIRRVGIGGYAETNEIPAHVYVPLWPGGWWNVDGIIAPLIDAICSRHGVEKLGLLTGLSSGGNGVYMYLVSGRDKVEKYAPMAINSSTKEILGMITKAKSAEIWHFHGNKDTDPNTVVTSSKFIDSYNLIYPRKAKRTVFSNKSHDCWTTVYGSKLTEPTVSPVSPLLFETFAPFDKSLYEWAFPTVVVPEPPVEPDPTKDKIIESYFDGDVIIHICESGKKLVVTPTA